MKKTEKIGLGKIYKLVSNETDKVYIGSTFENRLSNRLSGHRKSYKRWLKYNDNYITSFDIVKYDDCKIIELERYENISKSELTGLEDKCMLNYDNRVNRFRANRKKKEYRQDNQDKIREYQKEWYQDNQDKIREQKKEYYQDNQDKIREQKKEYRQANKEKIKEYYQANKKKLNEQQKEYYQANKEKLKEQQKKYYQAKKKKENSDQE